MLRQEWVIRLCSRAGLVLLLLLALSSPAALAASDKPKPQPLWEAFPLNPTGKRLGRVEETPAQGRPQVTEVTEVTKAEETLTQESRPSNTMLLLLGGAALLALVVFASMRRLSVRSRDPGATAAWSSPSESAQVLREPLAAQASAAGLGIERRAAALHPDVVAPAYRLRRVGRKPFRRSRVAPRGRGVQLSHVFAGGFTGVARRIKHTAWNDQTAPLIVGTTVGIFAAFLLIYWIG